MKKFLLLPLVLIMLTVGGIYWFYKNAGPVSSTEEYDYFVIEKGSSASQIAEKLETAGLIKNAFAFKIYLQLSGRAERMQSGEFRLTPSYSLFQIVESLMKGPVELWVTIPEGLRREEVALKFVDALDKDDSFVDEFMAASKDKEGYLFPETYLFPRDVTADAVVKKMTQTFTSKTQNLKNNSGLSFEKAIILASLLERETKTDAERPMVAGILLNRLNEGWPLQVDATVQYVVGTSKEWWPILTLENLSVKSAYNTYKNQGLPPAPIANPGLSSIRGVLNPTANDYWYYIHDGSGKIHYATTLSEHNANIAKYLGK